MPITIDGDGTITGVSVGGLPDGIVDADMLAAGAVTAAKRGAGGILQVKQTFVNTANSQDLTAKTLAEISGLSVAITPTQSDSNMLVFVKWTGETSDDNHKTVFGLKRDSTEIGSAAAAGNRLVGMSLLSQGYHTEDNTSTPDSASYFFIDENRPSGTTQITYKATILNHSTVTLYNNRTVNDADSDEHERVASSILVMEVAA